MVSGTMDFKNYSNWVKGQQPEQPQDEAQAASDMRIKRFLTGSLNDDVFRRAIYGKVAGIGLLPDETLKLMLMKELRNGFIY